MKAGPPADLGWAPLADFCESRAGLRIRALWVRSARNPPGNRKKGSEHVLKLPWWFKRERRNEEHRLCGLSQQKNSARRSCRTKPGKTDSFRGNNMTPCHLHTSESAWSMFHIQNCKVQPVPKSPTPIHVVVTLAMSRHPKTRQ